MPASSHPQHQHPEEGDLHTGAEPEHGDESIRVPLTEETLQARIVDRDRGALRIHRRVETDPIQTSVDLRQDRYAVDRVEVNELATERRDPWYEGDTLMIPVYEEVLVTETRLMLREIIHLRNEEEIEQVNLRGTLRRDVVDIERRDSQGRVSQLETPLENADSAPE